MWTQQPSASAFTQWFSSSVVVDASCRPQRVFHGTVANDTIERFEGYSYAGWFTVEPTHANIYAGLSDNGVEVGGTIYPVFLSISKPLNLSALDANHDFDAATLAGMMGVDPEEVQSFFDEYATGPSYWNLIDTASFREWVEALGCDGVSIREAGVLTWAPISPQQVKSAIGNNGAFNPADPRIVH